MNEETTKRPRVPGSGMKKGYDAGGIRTLDDLRLRCDVDPVSDCWRWKMGLTVKRADGKGVPKVHFVHPVTGKRKQSTGRRVAFTLATGKDVPAGRYVFARPCCDWDDCVNPAHGRTGNREEHGKWLQKTEKLKGRKGYIDASRRRANAQQALSASQVAEVRRNLHVTIKEYARRFNVAQSVIWSARNYRTYQDVAVRASVFDLGGIAA